MNKVTSVGLIGVGTMGRGLGRNIVMAGFELSVFDPQQEAMGHAASLGARPCANPSEVAARANVVLTCLPSLEAIRTAYLGEDGVIAGAPRGGLFADCSTRDPDLTRQIGLHVARAGCALIDTPMLRNAQAAWEGKLHLLAGGAAEDIAMARPVLEAVCEQIVETGPLGSAHVVKLLNNAATIVNSIIVAEAFTLARKFNVDLQSLYGVLASSQASSKSLHSFAPRLMSDDHAPTFSLDIALKDITLYTRLGDIACALTPLGQAARNLMQVTSALGFGAEHYSRVATLLAKSAGLRIEDRDNATALGTR
jgi:3-hydroxyisobutyrate dehydrogenase-like beta-hydroxyacid dehydrogenase